MRLKRQSDALVFQVITTMLLNIIGSATALALVIAVYLVANYFAGPALGLGAVSWHEAIWLIFMISIIVDIIRDIRQARMMKRNGSK